MNVKAPAGLITMTTPYTFVCGCNQTLVPVPSSVVAGIPYLQALDRSGMEDIKTMLIKKPDAEPESYQQLVNLMKNTRNLNLSAFAQSEREAAAENSDAEHKFNKRFTRDVNRMWYRDMKRIQKLSQRHWSADEFAKQKKRFIKFYEQDDQVRQSVQSRVLKTRVREIAKKILKSPISLETFQSLYRVADELHIATVTLWLEQNKVAIVEDIVGELEALKLKQ